jgi:Peptidase A4 family
MDVRQSRKELHETLGIRLFTSPPDGFDPIAASDRELLVHGYPARPDRDKQPDVHEGWRRVFAQPLTIIEPEFLVRPTPSPRPAGKPKYGDSAWAGSSQFSNPGDPMTWVTGEWTVPHVTGAPFSGICASWIGIDGAPSSPSIEWDSTDILQAGTTQETIGGFAYFSYAWFEWYPDPWVQVSNFPVAPGDTVSCTICVYDPTEAVIHLVNLTSGVMTSFGKSPKGSFELVGNSAEWIVELPDAGIPLARFGEIFFDACAAGTAGGELLLGGQGHLQTIYGFDSTGHSKPLAVASAENDLVVKVRYIPLD